MTLQGTVNKTILSLCLLLATGAWLWLDASQETIYAWMIGGFIGGFVLALVTVFKKEWAPITVPLYAIAEGLALGGISWVFEQQYPGIVGRAVTLTMGVFFALLFAYKFGAIRATEKFRSIIMAATLGIGLVYLVSFIMSFFGATPGFLYEGSWLGIGFSLFVVGIAALNLVLDFDLIERGVASKAPKFMEWYGTFALLVTLVWLYIEMLRLLAKLSDRR